MEKINFVTAGEWQVGPNDLNPKDVAWLQERGVNVGEAKPANEPNIDCEKKDIPDVISQLGAIGVDRATAHPVEFQRSKGLEQAYGGIRLGRNVVPDTAIRQPVPRFMRTEPRATGGRGKMKF